MCFFLLKSGILGENSDVGVKRKTYETAVEHGLMMQVKTAVLNICVFFQSINVKFLSL